jgi:hypothetical protein
VTFTADVLPACIIDGALTVTWRAPAVDAMVNGPFRW